MIQPVLAKDHAIDAVQLLLPHLHVRRHICEPHPRDGEEATSIVDFYFTTAIGSAATAARLVGLEQDLDARSRRADLGVTGQSIDDLPSPVLDGLAALNEIRKFEKSAKRRTPVIALTAHTETADRDHYLELGMDDYVCKPIDFEELKEKLYKVLES